MERQYNAGLYVRLSVEDAVNSQKRGKGNPFQHESTSVENQKTILEEYAQLRGWSVARVYADDGFSGGNYDRPAFLEMIADAKAGLINLILVKDLSRLGRDYIETGRYTDEIFPELGVRFVALMDGIDSEGCDDILPFRSILNDYHLKDLSRKIKSVLRAKAEAGAYVGAFAPYGYIKSSDNPARLIVDPEAAAVVRRIFDMRFHGDGYRRIAIRLNVDGVLPAREYWYRRDGKPNPYKSKGKWTDHTVKQVLTNETYLGHSVKFRTGTVSYKNKKHIVRQPEDWIRVENTHPPIIRRDIWDAVQELNRACRPAKPRNKPDDYIFSGILFCGDCGSVMVGQRYTNKRKDGTEQTGRMYSCSRKRQIDECSWHSITEDTLRQIIYEDVRRHMEQITIDESAVVRALHGAASSASLSEAKRKLHALEARLCDIAAIGEQLYEDRLAGVICLDTFKSLSAKTEDERVLMQTARDALADDIEKAERQISDVSKWIDSVRHYAALESPDRETVRALVERINVGAAVGRGKNKRQDVAICYRFAGRRV